ncbi:hypothetical protein NL676_029681 [Syzygium grande]|nr:hypothetical protein NL676_029681 [Syzygium grande]
MSTLRNFEPWRSYQGITIVQNLEQPPIPPPYSSLACNLQILDSKAEAELHRSHGPIKLRSGHSAPLSTTTGALELVMELLRG